MNPPQVYMCSPSWTLLPPPSPIHPSGSSQKHFLFWIPFPPPRNSTCPSHYVCHVSHVCHGCIFIVFGHPVQFCVLLLPGVSLSRRFHLQCGLLCCFSAGISPLSFWVSPTFLGHYAFLVLDLFYYFTGAHSQVVPFKKGALEVNFLRQSFF